jgi:hypothetical protein
MKMLFRAYRLAPAQTCLLDETAEREMRGKGLLPEAAELLWELTADTPEEASAIHYLRMGFGPFQPQGESSPCPRCGAVFYPEGSGCCWRCGKIG